MYLDMRKAVLAVGAALVGGALAAGPAAHRGISPKTPPVAPKVVKSEEEWRRLLTPEQFNILRKKGTERAFTGKYHNYHGVGTYVCAADGNELFKSETKFESGTGWPSFWAPLRKESIRTETDRAFGMSRTEVTCARCGGHLGHVFDDGPKPTGLRYCMNSAALKFVPRKSTAGAPTPTR